VSGMATCTFLYSLVGIVWNRRSCNDKGFLSAGAFEGSRQEIIVTNMASKAMSEQNVARILHSLGSYGLERFPFLFVFADFRLSELTQVKWKR
jgi:hypothetical protein